MTTLRRRILTIGIVLAMVLGMMPAMTFAEDEEVCTVKLHATSGSWDILDEEDPPVIEGDALVLEMDIDTELNYEYWNNDYYALEAPAGKALAGWTEEEGNPETMVIDQRVPYSETAGCVIEEDMELYAYWVQACTLTVNGNGCYVDGDWDDEGDLIDLKEEVDYVFPTGREIAIDELITNLDFQDFNENFNEALGIVGWSLDPDPPESFVLDHENNYTLTEDVTIYAFFSERERIDQIDVKVTAPKKGMVIDDDGNPQPAVTIIGENYRIQTYLDGDEYHEDCSWMVSDGEGGFDYYTGTIKEGQTYYAEINLEPCPGYYFDSENTVINVNGKELEDPYPYLCSEYAVLDVPFAFPWNDAPIYRLYNPKTKEHLYTSAKKEYDVLPGYGWKQEGVGWYAPKTGQSVYRLYNPKTKDHHYTCSANEAKVLTSSYGWKYDNNAKPVFKSGGNVNVYRLYNKSLKIGSHHLTTNKNEYNVLPKYGWKQEGVAMKATRTK